MKNQNAVDISQKIASPFPNQGRCGDSERHQIVSAVIAVSAVSAVIAGNLQREYKIRVSRYRRRLQES